MEALKELVDIEKDARDFGFEWKNYQASIDQVMDECREIMEDVKNNASREKLQEEVGDLILAAVSVCSFAGFDVFDTISKNNAKFKKRMDAVKVITKNNGLTNLKGQSADILADIWKQAKEFKEK